jgi:hypothetical protein
VVWPSIVIPTVPDPSSPTGSPRRARHSDDRRGGVVEDGSRDRIDAEDVDHRVHDAGVGVADEGTERPPAGCAGGDDQLRHADGQDVHSRSPEQRALGSTQAQRAVEAALRPEIEHHAPDAITHALDCGSPGAYAAELVDVVATGSRDLLPRDVGRPTGRRPQDPESMTSGTPPRARRRSAT